MSENDKLVDQFVAYGIQLRQKTNVDERILKQHILYLSECAAKNMPEKFLERVIELYFKTNQEVPSDLMKVKDNPDLMSAFNIGLFGTTDDNKFLAKIE